MELWGESTSQAPCLSSVALHLAASISQALQAAGDSARASYAEHSCNWDSKAEPNQATLAHKLSEDVHGCESHMQLFWRALVGWWRRCQAALRTSSQLPLLGMPEWGSASLRLHPCFVTSSTRVEIICICLLEPMSSLKTETKQHPFRSPP